MIILISTMDCPLGTARPIMETMGRSWTVWVHRGHYGSIMDTMDPFGTARPIMDTMGPLGTSRPIVDTMGPSQTL
jgi:hypothetical protein